MISVTNTQNSIALQLLQSTSHSSANSSASARHSDPASIIGAISSGSDATNSPVTKALAEITRISLESGGEAISAGDDAKVTGTDFDDYIQVGNGATVNGGDGDDVIYSGHGSTINGGDGNDKIYTGFGSTVNGGNGDDWILGGAKSVMHGGEGNDRVAGGGEIHGDAGDDYVTGTGNLYGGEGDDTVVTGSTGSITDANTNAYGGVGNDTIQIYKGATGYGGEGNDTIEINYGEGAASGGVGDDRITVESNKDSDRVAIIKFDKGDDKDTIILQDGNATLELGSGLDADKINISYNEDGGEAVITFEGNENDQITISNDLRFSATNIVELKFADGSSQQITLDRGHGDYLGAGIEAYLRQTGQRD
ncbi:MAG: hypothetical protein ABJO57_09285 [Lentilitoribacter sp.]